MSAHELVIFDDEKIAIIKEMFCKNATKPEFELFITMAKRLQLDPICRQIYFIKFGQKMSIVVGIDGYRAIAERSGTYMPGREPSFTYDKEGKLFSCTAFAKKWSEKDRNWHEIAATAILSEYDTNQNQWAKGKHYMLAKTAEALVLRKGWPSQLAGTNTEEEMEKVILDVEASNKMSPRPVEIEQKPSLEVPCMGMQEDLILMEMIGDDIEYRNRIFTGYSNVLKRDVKSFLDIPSKDFNTIKQKIEAHNKERLSQELGEPSNG